VNVEVAIRPEVAPVAVIRCAPPVVSATVNGVLLSITQMPTLLDADVPIPETLPVVQEFTMAVEVVAMVVIETDSADANPVTHTIAVPHAAGLDDVVVIPRVSPGKPDRSCELTTIFGDIVRDAVPVLVPSDTLTV